MARKKTIKVQIGPRIDKTLHDALLMYCKNKNVSLESVVNDAIEEKLNPFDEENHDKTTRMQLSKIIKMLFQILNRLDILLIWSEEFIKTFFRNIPELVFEDQQAKIAANVRIIEGHEHFVKRVMDSAVNNNPNIISTFNMPKEKEE